MSFNNLSSQYKSFKYSENAFLPKYVTVPLFQDKNNEYKCLVNPGDFVSEGQLIAVAESKSSSLENIHSPIPGIVQEIKNVLCANSHVEQSIIIKLQGEFTFIGKKLIENKIELLSPSLILNKLKDFGVINTYDLNHINSLSDNISTAISNKSKILIVRLFDEDVYRIADSLMTKFNYKEILIGAEIVAKSLGADHIIFALDSKYLKDFNFHNDENHLFIGINSSEYTSGFSRKLISSINKNLKKDSMISVSDKDLFVDSYTLYHTYNALIYNIPFINNFIHFSGDCIAASCFLNVKLGYNLKDIVNQIGGFIKKPNKIIVNGEYVGYRISSLNIPISKEIKSIQFISDFKLFDKQLYSCIYCGACRDICPVNICPDILYAHSMSIKLASDAHLLSSKLCMECKLCNTVCQARLPLSQIISILKNKNEVNNE